MIRKWYEYSCDMCGRGITHLTYRCVSKKEFENIGIILYDNKHFCCEECKNNYINKNKENNIMSVNKYYEVECNKCGKIITRFNHYKPSVSVLNKYCTVVRQNGKQLTYCDECYSDNIQNKRRVREIGFRTNKENKRTDFRELGSASFYDK